MLLLDRGTRPRNQGSRLAEAKVELTEQTLALTHPEWDAVLSFDQRRQGLAVPEIDIHARVGWLLSQNALHFLNLLFRQARRATGALSFVQARQSPLLKAMNPIFDGPRRVTKEATNLWTGHSLRDQQDAMQPMVITRFFRSLNLLLQSSDHRGSLGYGQWSHDSSKPHLAHHAQLVMTLCLEEAKPPFRPL